MTSFHKSEEYVALSQDYIRQAETEFAQGDLKQAGERAWGAVVTAVKSISVLREWKHDHHTLTGNALREVADEFDREEWKHWFHTAESMHSNFYENSWAESEIRDGINRVTRLVSELAEVRQEPPRPIPDRSRNQERRLDSLTGG